VRAGPIMESEPARFGSPGAGGAHFPPPEQHAQLAAAAGVTGLVTLRQSPSFFCGQRAIPLCIQKMTMGLYPCGSHNRLTLAKVVRDSCIQPRLASRLRQWRSQEPGGHPNSRLKPSKRLRKWWRKG